MNRIASVTTVLVSANLAFGQLTVDVPKPLSEPPSNMIQWLITAVFMVAALVVAFKPAKRSKLE
ncbi:MAG TPA: hypothetical protein PL151_09735 [Phycisphaerae bacterium]|nr:hypothetical protein [Phycisphaerae bacterium]HOJ76179.1 hypothetical protein [Phycisphaerae bacterium]HOM53531.1 hypothetical protein [Phycisphaerae bacterium]HON65227.1 hypothetical protein [Phycisphaerae bacterium]HOQ86626.1 hypothetical protein [Phycisphaerae bacterium]